MRKWIWIIVIIIIILIGLAYWHYTDTSSVPAASTTDNNGPIAVVYTCDQGKTISAVDHNGPVEQGNPGEPPTPTGTVDVSIDGAATTTLTQTISADGARYGNADESLVFWNKGNTALIMRNNAMDQDYTNCTAQQS